MRRRPAAPLIAAVALVSACSGAPAGTPPSLEPAATAVAGSTAAPPPQSPSAPVPPPQSESAAEPPGPTPAPSTAGSLTQASLPSPAALGPGWAYRVDPGGAEEGYGGNGTPALAREPAEVVTGLQPLGCRTRRLPAPQHALEVSYRQAARQAQGVGLLLSFADAAAADAFRAAYTGLLRDCSTGREPLVRVLRDTAAAFVSRRTDPLADAGDREWTEVVRSRDATVLLVSANTSRGAVLDVAGLLAATG
ncbi:MAG: hypothetical protein EPO13_05040 [Actinomycetota bacterium]|nr:MAG: hypothetical protein EPO13_05040 [Actinomycetota bacterium]